MSKNCEFIFDFGSPNAYLVHQVLPALLQRTGAELVLTPCLLGGIFKATGNRPPSQAFAGVQGKMDYELLEMKRFMARHGITRFRMNSAFPVNTLLPMRALVAAQMEQVATPFVGAVLAAMWEQDRRIDDAHVLAEVLTHAGLDADLLLDRSAQPAVKQALIENTQFAVDRGVFGIPTFFVGNEMFFGKERLPQVEEELQR